MAAGSKDRSTRGWALPIGVVAGIAVLAFVSWQVLHRTGDKPGEGASPAPTQATLTDFIGSERCAECHGKEMAAWQGSQHQLAMQHPTGQSVLGDFEDASFEYGGVTSRFFRRDGKFFIQTDGADGKLADFEVEYTFGVYPLQQYLVELRDGHLQAVSIAWDSRPRESGGQRWFHLYPKQRVDYRDELHWTRRAQNWNFMCADCHSTNVRKGYDAATDSYQTKYSEVSVGCEACHGPGSAHVEWARQKSADPTKGLTAALDERHGVTWSPDPATGKPRRSAPRASEREIEVCAQCHARRAQVAEGYHAGRPFADHYLPALLTPALYHADGQQQDEVYIWGSWLQSRMHAAGVTCSDCHDPHTQKLRAPGNAVCAQCHDASKYEAASHHHHEPGSAGAQCADCHMPRTTYMVVDPRRDHSMRVPRPDESAAFGTPNACNACHADRDAKWAAAAVKSWYGRDASGFQSFAATFHAAESGSPGANGNLAAVAMAVAEPALVRASALERLASAGVASTELVQRTAGDAEPLVRLASTRMADSLTPESRATALAPLLRDPRRAVRIEAARALAGAQAALPAESHQAWQSAADEYVATLRYNADRPESRVALGGFFAATARTDEALAVFNDAIRFDPEFVPAYVNAADALRAVGRDTEAAGMLSAGLAKAPDSATLHHALGLTQVRLQQTDAAMASLKRATQLDPGVARYTYVYAVALNSTGRAGDAIQVLERAAQRWPHDRDMLMALASFQLDAGKTQAARKTVDALVGQYPEDREVQMLDAKLEFLRQRSTSN